MNANLVCLSVQGEVLHDNCPSSGSTFFVLFNFWKVSKEKKCTEMKTNKNFLENGYCHISMSKKKTDKEKGWKILKIHN